MRLLRPLHGWRAFVGEVGVIVLGVLLALGAQQLAEKIQMRGQIDTFRKTIDREIALDLFVYDARARQAPCVSKQLEQLDLWLGNARAGEAVSPIRSDGPVTYSYYRSAWDNRNATVFAHLPDDIRAKYAEFYDELANNDRLINLERNLWQSLDPYNEPGPMTLQDRRLVRSVAKRARHVNSLLVENIAISQKMAGDLGISKAMPEGVSEADPLITRCNSIIADR